MKMKCFLIAVILYSTGMIAQNTSFVEPFNRGKTEMMNGNLTESLVLLKQAQTLSPENLYIKYYIAKATSWQNKFEESKLIYTEIVQASRQDSEIYWMGFFGQSQIMGWQKEYDQALNNFQIILDNEKKYNIKKEIIRDARIAKADIVSWKKDYAAAIDLFKEMESENPSDVEVLNRIAKIYFWDFNLPESKKYSLMVLKIDSVNPEAKDRLKQIDDFKSFEVSAGYGLNYLTSENTDGDNVVMHNYFTSLKYNYNNELSFNARIQGATINSVETTDIDKQSELNTDFNAGAGIMYKFTPKIFCAFSADYTINAEILPDFNTDLSLSYKFSQNMDIFMNYKFTYDELDTYEKNKTLKNNIFAPGMSIYFSSINYIKIQPTLSTDFNDYNFLLSVTQNYGFNSYNLFAASIYYGTGKRIMEFSDATINQKTKSYGLSLTYTHYFNTVTGAEIFGAYSNYIDEYESYSAGIKGIYRF